MAETTGKQATVEGAAQGKQEKKYTLKKQAIEAAWLTSAGALTDLVQKTLVGFMLRGVPESDEGTRKAVANFMDSDVGKFIIAFVTSMSINTFGGLLGDKLPMVSEEKLAFLADRINVMAMARGGIKVVETFSEPLLNALMEALRGLPELPELPKEIEARRETIEEPLKDKEQAA